MITDGQDVSVNVLDVAVVLLDVEVRDAKRRRRQS